MLESDIGDPVQKIYMNIGNGQKYSMPRQGNLIEVEGSVQLTSLY